eukprot:363361-Chlamydomonas_euryale.AAC.10
MASLAEQARRDGRGRRNSAVPPAMGPSSSTSPGHSPRQPQPLDASLMIRGRLPSGCPARPCRATEIGIGLAKSMRIREPNYAPAVGMVAETAVLMAGKPEGPAEGCSPACRMMMCVVWGWKKQRRVGGAAPLTSAPATPVPSCFGRAMNELNASSAAHGEVGHGCCCRPRTNGSGGGGSTGGRDSHLLQGWLRQHDAGVRGCGGKHQRGGGGGGEERGAVAYGGGGSVGMRRRVRDRVRPEGACCAECERERTKERVDRRNANLSYDAARPPRDVLVESIAGRGLRVRVKAEGDRRASGLVEGC